MNKNHIEKFLLGELDDLQSKELLEWVEKSETNRAYFARMKNLWATTHLGNDNPNINLDDEYGHFRYKLEMKTAKEKPASDNIRFQYSAMNIFKKILRVAAVIVFLYSISLSYAYVKSISKVNYTEISTKRGEKSFVTLADGTRIWLNSETTLRYPSKLDSKNVNVYLCGEAYFDVAKVANRRFIVKTESLDIAVLGTSFNVKSYRAENIIETTLEEGKILITGKMGDLHIKEPIALLPNQQATFIKDINEYKVNIVNPTYKQAEPKSQMQEEQFNTIKKPEIIYTEKIDSELYTSWKDGKMVFKSERFQDIVLQMERWYDMNMEITSEELKDIKYTGVFEKETVEQALHALSLSFPFHFEINQNEITIGKAIN